MVVQLPIARVLLSGNFPIPATVGLLADFPSQIFVKSPRFSPRKILLIDDDEASALLLHRNVSRAFPRASLHRISSEMACSAITAGGADLVITAYRLIGRRAPDLLKEIRQIDGLVPVLVISSMPIYRAECLAAGATIFASFEDDLAAMTSEEVCRIQHDRGGLSPADGAVR